MDTTARLLDYSAAPRRQRPRARAAARRVGRQGPGARGGHRARRTSASTCSARRGCGSRYAGEIEARDGAPGRNEDELAYLRDSARLPQPAARRAAERQLRRHDRAAVPVRPMARPAAAASSRCRATNASPASRRRRSRKCAITSSARATGSIRLGDGTDESHARMQARHRCAVDVHRRDVRRRCDRARADRRRHRRRCRGAACRRGKRRSQRCSTKRRSSCPPITWMQGARSRGGKQGVHTEHLVAAACRDAGPAALATRKRDGDRGDAWRVRPWRASDATHRARRSRHRRSLARARHGRRSRDPGRVDRRARHRPRRGERAGDAMGRDRYADVFAVVPATRVIEADIRARRSPAATRRRVRIVTALSPAWTTDWIAPEARRKLRRSAASRRRTRPRDVGAARRSRSIAARERGALPALRVAADVGARALRLDGMQGAIPLHRLPRAVRLLQAALSGTAREQVPSACRLPRSSARRATRSPSRSTCPPRCASCSASSRDST